MKQLNKFLARYELATAHTTDCINVLIDDTVDDETKVQIAHVLANRLSEIDEIFDDLFQEHEALKASEKERR